MSELKINTKKILTKYVAVLKTENGYENNKWREGEPVAMNVPLKHVLYDIVDRNEDWLKKVQEMEYHSKEQAEAKALTPRYYICGVFDMNEYMYSRFPIHDYPKEASNLMTIDIDAKDNPDIDIWKLREDIFKLPYVFSCIKSVSGKGFYVIIPIEDTHYTKEYYHYIERLWKHKYGIVIDSNADTIIRARIISYDEDREKWIKKDTDIKVWDLKYIEIKKEEKSVIREISYSKYESKKSDNNLDWEEITHKAMIKLIDDGYTVNSYKAWYHLGCELANFDDGYELFYKASKNYDNSQAESSIAKRWKGCESSGITDDLIRKWCGMAKNKYGAEWMKKIK